MSLLILVLIFKWTYKKNSGRHNLWSKCEAWSSCITQNFREHIPLDFFFFFWGGWESWPCYFCFVFLEIISAETSIFTHPLIIKFGVLYCVAKHFHSYSEWSDKLWYSYQHGCQNPNLDPTILRFYDLTYLKRSKSFKDLCDRSGLVGSYNSDDPKRH